MGLIGVMWGLGAGARRRRGPGPGSEGAPPYCHTRPAEGPLVQGLLREYFQKEGTDATVRVGPCGHPQRGPEQGMGSRWSH